MKKLNLLKTIVDYVWIFSIILYPLAIISLLLLMTDSFSFDFVTLKISRHEIQLKTIWNKIVLIINFANFGLLLFTLYNFKELLKSFKEKLIFETDTCLKLDKIGKLIIYSSLIYLSGKIILKLSQKTVSIELYGPFLYLISLGIFFRVLAEVFKIGKNIKEENELTV